MALRDENRFELREPIRSLLKTFRKLAKADACALYLISYEMDNQEKEEELRKRFDKAMFDAESKKDYEQWLKKANAESTENDTVLVYVNTNDEYVNTNDEDDIVMKYTKENVDNLTFKHIKLDDYLNKSKNMSRNTEYYDVLRFIGVSEDKKSRWKIEYKTRPDKYIVFNHQPLKNAGCIIGEGATCIAVRRGKPIYFDNRIKMLTHLSRINRVGDDLRREIHNQCQKMLALPLIDGNETKGVIRFDIYDQKRNFDEKFIEYYFSNLQENRVLFAFQDIIRSIIDDSTQDAEEKSYKKIYRGIELLDSLKSLEISVGNVEDEFDNLNYQVYTELLLHLFFVFKRHTYIGEDEIMKRVVYFADDLAKTIKLPNGLSFSEILKPFKRHEDLMLYESKQYRDHFMHQFHVFVVGYIILNHFKFDKIAESITKRLKTIHKYESIKITPANVLRIWVLAAFFHDICYLFERFETGIADFLKSMLNVNIPVRVDWSRILCKGFENSEVSNPKDSEGSKYASYLHNIILLFKSIDIKKRTNRIESFGAYIQAILEKNDHAIFSALYLIELYENLPDNQKDTITEVEFYLAALAIAIHNGIYKHLMMGEKFQLSFESFPLEFLLIYCDLVQEWGRTVKTNEGFDATNSPILEKLIINDKKVLCILFYPTSIHPSKEELKNYTKDIKAHLCSKCRFGVMYKFKNDNIALVVSLETY